MEILEFNDELKFDEELILVLGYFDGLHRGHQSLFTEAKKIAAVLNLKIAAPSARKKVISAAFIHIYGLVVDVIGLL